MKAFLVKQPHEFRLIDSEIPRLAPQDVLVRVGACGICGSDLDIIEGSRPMEVTAYPLIAGHEFAGRVEEVGSAVEDLRLALVAGCERQERDRDEGEDRGSLHSGRVLCAVPPIRQALRGYKISSTLYDV